MHVDRRRVVVSLRIMRSMKAVIRKACVLHTRITRAASTGAMGLPNLSHLVKDIRESGRPTVLIGLENRRLCSQMFCDLGGITFMILVVKIRKLTRRWKTERDFWYTCQLNEWRATYRWKHC